ncbi:MAG: type II secretion system F family protein [Patescibacteria group bacterium]
MAQFKYKAKASDGALQEGVIDAGTLDLAVASLQRRNLLILSIEPAEEKKGFVNELNVFLGYFSGIKQQDIVILSRQLSTLFEAKVPIVESFKVIITETQSAALRKHLTEILDDIQGGLSLSGAMVKHPEAFSKFYVAMIKSGEESGKLEEIFIFLAEYLERTFELARKARNALIYPAFVLGAFVVVMILMLIFVIPNISTILTESGQELPFYTKIVIGMSNILRQFGIFIMFAVVVAGGVLYQYARKAGGALYFSRVQISMPILGNLYRKLYLARIADNLHTLLSGGITVVRALTITSEVVGNEVYSKILLDATESVKGGSMISEAFGKYRDIPPLFSQMIRIGEETGKLDFILKSVAGFYRRDVDNLVDNLVSLIEPIMILVLGLGVGLLVASVLIPIYNLAGAF